MKGVTTDRFKTTVLIVAFVAMLLMGAFLLATYFGAAMGFFALIVIFGVIAALAARGNLM